MHYSNSVAPLLSSLCSMLNINAKVHSVLKCISLKNFHFSATVHPFGNMCNNNFYLINDKRIVYIICSFDFVLTGTVELFPELLELSNVFLANPVYSMYSTFHLIGTYRLSLCCHNKMDA